MVKKIVNNINIPLFIAIKGEPANIREMNIELLKYAYVYLKGRFNFDRVYIVSDNQEVLDIAGKLGFTNLYLEKCKHCPVCKIDIIGIYHCILDWKINCDWFINFRIPQPFKGNRVLVDCINAINENYDMVASYSWINDRSNYFIDNKDNWINETDHRLAEYCPKVKMVDGSIFCHKTSHFMEIVPKGHFDTELWKGKIKFIENKAMFLPIFGLEQVKQLDIAEVAFLEVGKLKELK